MGENIAEALGYPVINIPPAAETPDAVILYMLEWMERNNKIAPGSAVDIAGKIEASNTGIGSGVAIPYQWCDSLSIATGLVGLLQHEYTWVWTQSYHEVAREFMEHFSHFPRLFEPADLVSQQISIVCLVLFPMREQRDQLSVLSTTYSSIVDTVRAVINRGG